MEVVEGARGVGRVGVGGSPKKGKIISLIAIA